MLDRARASHVLTAFGFSADVDRLLTTRLVECGRWVELEPGARAFSEGDSCSSFFIVDEGCIRVAKTNPAGQELLLYNLLPGEICIVTASSLLGDIPYSARGTAFGLTNGIAAPGPVFHNLVTDLPEFR